MSNSVASSVRIELNGVVQGVGFRPFVHRLATELDLRGVVGNEGGGVFVEAAGPASAIERFRARLVSEAPPLAHIATVDVVRPLGLFDAQLSNDHGFVIVDSEPDPSSDRNERAYVSPDVATCDECLAEMRDRSNRRFGHPFITCTNCGPRFTIIRELPYDRPATTMSSFEMCSACAGEYGDPNDRRFHAQPIACHDCGPTLRWEAAERDDALAAATRCLLAGGIAAVKGIGGYQLAVRADSDDGVAALRRRKQRPDKPFAVMVADLDMARSLADLTAREAELLTSPAAPIVLCRAVTGAPISDSVAPGNPLIGIMVASTPLHHLLFDRLASDRTAVDGTAVERTAPPLVMTSGNLNGEPIAHADDDAMSRLADIADGFLTHDRPIHLPCDDSVVRVVDGDLMPIRRARGYAPLPIVLASDAADVSSVAPDVVAVGGELKNAFCVTSGDFAWMSQHIGDMENLETFQAFEASLDRFVAFYGVTPDLVAADSHPGYLSSSWARSNHGDRVVEVQHHHAHVAAVMAEHGLVPSESVLGVAFDGTGHGPDGSIWGGELLVADGVAAERVGHLRTIALPGGDAAIRHPWRVALSHLRTAGIEWDLDLPPVAAAGEQLSTLLARQIERDVNCVPTSSMGRFFDALASLVGLRQEISFEAQAAIELEIAAAGWSGPIERWPFSLDDPTPLLVGVCEAVRAGNPVAAIARSIHESIAVGVADDVVAASANALDTVALSGGVFQNALLVELLGGELRRRGLRVLTHRLVPPNDGGLALGQAFITRARTLESDPDPDHNEEG